jgi:hypothetical protein
MCKVLYIVAFGLALAACPGPTTLSWDFFTARTPPPPPEPTALRLESDPPGAEAKTSFGAGCMTPCSVPLTGARGDFAITMTREGYLPQTVPVQVAAPETPGAGGLRLTPNPVFAKLEPVTPPKKKKKAGKKVAAKPKPSTRSAAAATESGAPATETAAPASESAAPSTLASWPWLSR